MKINSSKVISDFNLRPFGQKGWLASRDLKCPGCGRGGKLGFMVKDNGGVVHCFICELSIPLVKFLKDNNREDLYTSEKVVHLKPKLPELTKKGKVEFETELPEATMPIGWTQIYDNEYLRGRNYTDEQFQKYPVGTTDSFLEQPLHNYLIFPLYQHKKIVAWLARSTRSYEWHSENLKLSKQGLAPLFLRYRNSVHDFSKIVGGIDEVTNQTKTLIIVEGFFDKLNIDRLLGLYEDENIKCVCTFGNSIKDSQVALFEEFGPNIDNIIMMYDDGTIKQTKHFGLILSHKYNVKVAELTDPDVDPGNITSEQLGQVLSNLKNISYYYTNRISNKLNRKRL